MFDDLVQWLANYPYPAVALVFVLCGMGLPLPEELVLIAAGYICATYPDKAALHWMIAWCAGGILTGDLVPFVLGRTFGTRLLRLRWLRLLVTRRRLAKFDNWFRRRGDLVIFIARFIAGIRAVAFFTAGTMKMPIRRFLLLDGCGIVLIVPVLTWVGSHFADVIDSAILRVRAIERGLLWSTLAALVVAGGWLWLWRRRRSRALASPAPAETFVEPRLPVQNSQDETPAASVAPTAPAPIAAPAPPVPAAAPAPPADPAPPTFVDLPEMPELEALDPPDEAPSDPPPARG
jgi:membrane protein DedA with SNARE-associated domain